ncbi:MAG: hypothetical protein K0R28_627 [Paenibacillus sp.]|jgi:ABC-type glycerol-3-phosphate transport system substrate-binding protein|nr:hypothetical protein [Paenibacillus sp.]
MYESFETDERIEAVELPHFPTRMQVVIWRNWGLVSPERIAQVLEATVEQVCAAAFELGLSASPNVDPLWETNGYVTIIRANWHLLSFPQLLQLLDWPEEKLWYTLKEDDSLWIKMGRLKPRTEPVRYRPLTEAERDETARLRERLSTYFGENREFSPPVAPGVVGGRPIPANGSPAYRKEFPFDFLRDFRAPVADYSSLHEENGWNMGTGAPKPVEYGGVVLHDGWRVVYSGKGMRVREFVRRFNYRFQQRWGFSLRPTEEGDIHAAGEGESTGGSGPELKLIVLPDRNRLAESHDIDVRHDGITVTAVDENGLLRGLQWIWSEAIREGRPALPPGLRRRTTKFDLRFIYSYFAVYGDPLTETGDADPYPETFLERLSDLGVNGVWLQCVLYRMVPWHEAPELSEGWEKRIAGLRALTERAARYGIGVYVYLNELRGLPSPFFEKRPEWKGHSDDGKNFAMCTSVPEVKQFLEEGTFRLLQEVPGLSGLFSITMAENLTNCHSRAWNGVINCPRCRTRPVQEVSAEVNSLIASGARRANPDVRLLYWTWGWVPKLGWSDEAVREAIAQLPEASTVMCTSEAGKATDVAGIPGVVVDYSLSIIGPSESSVAIWRLAEARGLARAAKVQLNNTWECAAVPYMPVFASVEEHLNRLEQSGVTALMLSWTLGGYPSLSLELASGYYWQEETGADTRDLGELLRRRFGEAAGDCVLRASRQFGEAFKQFPFHVTTLYMAPQNYGPSNRLFLRPSGYKATMVGLPYDDLDTWRSIYPRDVFTEQFKRLSEGWREGLALLESGTALVPERFADDYERLLQIADAAYCHFRSTYLQCAFVMERDVWLESAEPEAKEGARRKLISILHEEIDLAVRLHGLMERDSTIGYEASNHYFYTVQDLREKVLNALDIVDRLSSASPLPGDTSPLKQGGKAMKNIRTTIAMPMLALLLMTAAACGKSGTDTGNSPEPEAVAPPKEPVTISIYWPYGVEETFMKDYGAQIRDKFPHVTVKFIPFTKPTQIDELVTTGEQLDLIFASIGSLDHFVLSLGLQSDITPYVDKAKYDLGIFEQSSLEMLKQLGNGKLLGLPLFDTPAMMYYNKDLFDKFGVPYPRDGMTWDDVYNESRRLTVRDNGVQYYGALLSTSHLALRNQLSLDLVDPKTVQSTLTSDKWKSFLDNAVRFYQLPGPTWDKTNLQIANQGNLFLKDKTVAMWLPVSAMYGQNELQGMNWDMAQFPSFKEAPNVGPQAYPFYILLSETSKHKETAFDVMTYLTSESFQLEKSKQGAFVSLLKNEAVRNAFGQDSALYKGKNVKALFASKYAAPMYWSKYNATAGGQLFNAFIAAAAEQVDVNTALHTADETVNKVITADQKK